MRANQSRTDCVIEASHPWLKMPWREIVEYKDLLFILVRRDFVAQYKQTVLGPIWFVLQPLATTLVFTVIFAHVAKIPTNEVPPMLFYLCGLLMWGYFARCLTHTSSTFIGNAGLFGKVYFPRLIIPFASVLSGLIPFIIQFVTFLGFLGFYKFFTSAGDMVHLSWIIVAFPLALIQCALLGLGVGLWICSMTAKYRDFTYLIGFMTQTWMYLTPIVYPLSEVPERWRWLSALNPMTAVVEYTREAFLGAGTLDLRLLMTSVSIGLIMLISGLIVFNRVERTFVDTI